MNNRVSYQTEVAIGGTPAPAANAQDEMAVRQLFQAQMAAWDAGDAEAYGALFTEDADYLAFDGVNQKGRAAIIAGHKPLFEKFLRAHGSRAILSASAFSPPMSPWPIPWAALSMPGAVCPNQSGSPARH